MARLEAESLHQRSVTDRVSDSITRFAGSTTSIILHIIWFSIWIIVNAGRIDGIKPFDPYPFIFLTLVVSIEAIFLSIFVLISQNRMTHLADRRAHLDLQVNLLAEQENTIILRMLETLCEKEGIATGPMTKEVQAFFAAKDLHALADELNRELPEDR
jgi:uncharacterized membrane protein